MRCSPARVAKWAKERWRSTETPMVFSWLHIHLILRPIASQCRSWKAHRVSNQRPCFRRILSATVVAAHRPRFAQFCKASMLDPQPQDAVTELGVGWFSSAEMVFVNSRKT